ncbi:MAG: hemerythrin domain-containing protein [Bdellovibrionota bacterium]
MKLTDALLGEHGPLYALFDELERILPTAKSIEVIKTASQMLAAALVTHAKIEEEMLFPALETHIGPMGPLSVMRAEHEEIEAILENLQQTDNMEDAKKMVLHVLETTRSHFAKEENVLFGLARQSIDHEEMRLLAQRWADRRHIVIS